MTTPTPVTNPCTQCGEQEALFSVMSLSDFSQVKLCGTCAVTVFRGVADDIEQAGLAAATAETVAEMTDPAGDVAAETVPAAATEPPADTEPPAATSTRPRETKTDAG